MIMDSNCKYFGSILMTFLIYSTAVSYPNMKREVECKTLTNLYPPKLNLNDTLNSCRSQNLSGLLQKYCTELSLVWNEISSCGLGSLLEGVPRDIYMGILSKSQKVLMTEGQNICEGFEKLNNSLYKVYLDNPGIGKDIAGVFCHLFCEKWPHHCEMLLRTYWIKKVFLDFKETDEHAKEPDLTEAVTQAEKKPGISSKASIHMPQTEQLNKESQVNPIGPGTASTSDNIPVSESEQDKETPKAQATTQDFKNHGHSAAANATEHKSNHILPLTPKPEPQLPGETGAPKDADGNTKKSKSVTKLPINKTDGNKETKTHKTTLDSNLQNIDDDPNLDQNKQEDSSNLKNKQDVNGKKPDDSSKSINPNHDAVEDPNLKTKPKHQLDDASVTKAKPNDVGSDASVTKEKSNEAPTVVSETKEIPPPPISQPKEKDKDEGNDNLDGQIPVSPDKVIGDDTATNLDTDTELGNQIRDFGDGYAVNEYQDAGPPDESEIPPPVESVQPASKDDKNLQPDETKVEKQVTDGSQLSGYPEGEDGHFFPYFLTIIVFCIAGYLIYHNKQKIIALIIEGRHERRRRPNNGAYKRLDSKDGAKATSHVIF